MKLYDKVINHLRWRLSRIGSDSRMDDIAYIKKKYKQMVGHECDLENPQALTEKIQWLKLYNHNPSYTKMADKYEAKKYVAGLIGEEHIIPTYGVWDSFDEIDFDSLPDQFILKCTHNSGGFVICKDKNTFDKKAAKKRLTDCLNHNYFYSGREWVYKNIKPRIIAEKYIDSLGKPDSVEYKTTCFNGKVGFVTICTGIAHSDFELRTNDHYDVDFHHMPWYVNYKNADVPPKKPEQWDELIAICEKLSKDIPYVRVDTYIIDGQIYFGEMTFYTWSGFMKFNPPEWDLKLGEMLVLPDKKIQ